MNTPGAHDLCTFATLVPPSEMPFPSLCLNPSLLWTHCSNPNPPGKSFPIHTASRSLLNSKKTHYLSCKRTLTSSGRSFWFIFMCPCLALLPGCEPLEGEDLVNLCNWHIENAQSVDTTAHPEWLMIWKCATETLCLRPERKHNWSTQTTSLMCSHLIYILSLM